MAFFKTKAGDIRVGRIIVLSVIALFGVITLLSSCTKVDVGCTGVQVVLGSVEEQTLEPGFHLVTPFVTKVVDMDNKVRKVEVNAGSTSKDLQSVDSTLAVNYHLAKEASLNMYKNVGLNYEDTILQPAIQEATKSVMAGYKAEELIQSRGLVSNAIMDEITRKVQDYGLVIDEFNMLLSRNSLQSRIRLRRLLKMSRELRLQRPTQKRLKQELTAKLKPQRLRRKVKLRLLRLRLTQKHMLIRL